MIPAVEIRALVFDTSMTNCTNPWGKRTKFQVLPPIHHLIKPHEPQSTNRHPRTFMKENAEILFPETPLGSTLTAIAASLSFPIVTLVIIFTSNCLIIAERHHLLSLLFNHLSRHFNHLIRAHDRQLQLLACDMRSV